MILVVGATGRLGGAIARRLLEAGNDVRILVRPGSSHGPLVDAGAEPVTGDLKDRASLRTACTGVETVLTTANAIGRSGADTVERVDVEGNASLIDAAEAGGVRHFVFTSVLGADAASPVPFTRAKGLAERRLENSAMTWTILQPNVFMDTSVPVVVGAPALAGQPVTLVGEGRRRHSMVAMNDVALYAVAAVDHAEARNRRLPVGGPEPISWRDVVAAFERVLGREIPVRTVPPGEPVPGLPDAINGLFQALETYDSPVDMAAAAATFGVQPTGIEDFVRDFVSSRSAASRR
ncbi:MAG TPA: SDR family oxidoreductase [Acidimicrobiales bacterium]|nr:SDR family oxidoreductase [Acidimicrobiales bacterium]